MFPLSDQLPSFLTFLCDSRVVFLVGNLDNGDEM